MGPLHYLPYSDHNEYQPNANLYGAPGQHTLWPCMCARDNDDSIWLRMRIYLTRKGHVLTDRIDLLHSAPVVPDVSSNLDKVLQQGKSRKMSQG